MKIEDIEIFAGTPDFQFDEIRRLEVKCEATNALMPAPTVDEANGRLRALAAKVGANAIIQANYDSGISLTSWKSLKATGLAVRRISEDTTCPMCAETIKRAALKCRYCGADIPKVQSEEGQKPSVPSAAFASSPADAEPLTDSNNPALIIGAVIFGLFIILMLAGAN